MSDEQSSRKSVVTLEQQAYAEVIQTLDRWAAILGEGSDFTLSFGECKSVFLSMARRWWGVGWHAENVEVESPGCSRCDRLARIVDVAAESRN